MALLTAVRRIIRRIYRFVPSDKLFIIYDKLPIGFRLLSAYKRLLPSWNSI